MKNIFLTIISILTFISCKAQIVGIEEQTSEEAGYYYKDLNNVLDLFEGTYLYNNGNTSFEIILQKKVASSRNGIFTEDLLIGGYQYIKNGVEQTNTLNSINTFQSNGRFYPINGNNINEGKYRCTECDINEKWLRISIEGVNHVHSMFVRKVNISGAEAIKIYILPAEIPGQFDTSPPLPPVILPVNQWITLIKQ